MVFSSIVFLFVFLPIVLFTYYAAPKVMRNAILLIASLLFYAWGEPVYILLMIGSTFVAYFSGRRIDHYLHRGQKKQAKKVLLLALVFHVGCLLFFKYTDFIIDNLNQLCSLEIPNLKLALPIGISFYTFQILSYLVDVYWGKVAVQKNWLNLATYVALFPQLIAGPIVRYETVEEEMQSRQENVDEFAQGVRRFVIGLGKKVLIANTVGELYTTVHAMQPGDQSVMLLWLAAVSYTIQIYYDFSGYSDMAIGLGKMFGFHFLENFNYPYISTSITEFWRRWHISLSSWFRDYVYIPLGGNRVVRWKHYRNIIIVWFLTGLWHGAEWTFILWGLYFCALLLLEKSGFGNVLKRLPLAVQHIYTMVLVIISWTIFSAENFSDFVITIKGMFFLNGLSFYNDFTSYYLVSYAVLLILAVIGATPLPKRFYKKYVKVASPVAKQYTFQMGSLNTNGEVTIDESEEYVAAAVSLESQPVYWEKESYHKEYGITMKDIGKITLEIVLIFLIFFVSIAYLVSASFNPFLYFRF